MEKMSETDKAIEILNKYQFIFDKGTEYCSLLDALEQLKSYEDTGLEPEDVKAIYSASSNIVKFVIDKRELNNKYNTLLEMYDKLQNESIKLPYKVGDTVYYTSNFMGGILEEKIIEITFDKWGYRIKLQKGRVFNDNELNKKWFLTKEEAEKELERLKGAEVDG